MLSHVRNNKMAYIKYWKKLKRKGYTSTGKVCSLSSAKDKIKYFHKKGDKAKIVDLGDGCYSVYRKG